MKIVWRKDWPKVVLALMLLVSSFLTVKVCRIPALEKSILILETKNAALEKAAEESKEIYDGKEVAWEKERKALNQKVEDAITVIASISGQLDSSNFKIEELMASMESAKGYEEKYWVATKVITEYQVREKTYWKPLIDEQDKIILAEKQNAAGERRLRLNLETAYADLEKAYAAKEKENSALRSLNSSLKLKAKITFIGGLGGSALAFLGGMALGK